MILKLVGYNDERLRDTHYFDGMRITVKEISVKEFFDDKKFRNSEYKFGWNAFVEKYGEDQEEILRSNPSEIFLSAIIENKGKMVFVDMYDHNVFLMNSEGKTVDRWLMEGR